MNKNISTRWKFVVVPVLYLQCMLFSHLIWLSVPANLVQANIVSSSANIVSSFDGPMKHFLITVSNNNKKSVFATCTEVLRKKTRLQINLVFTHTNVLCLLKTDMCRMLLMFQALPKCRHRLARRTWWFSIISSKNMFFPLFKPQIEEFKCKVQLVKESI